MTWIIQGYHCNHGELCKIKHPTDGNSDKAEELSKIIDIISK